MTPTAMPVTYGLDASMARFSLARYQRMIEAGILIPILTSTTSSCCLALADASGW